MLNVYGLAPTTPGDDSWHSRSVARGRRPWTVSQSVLLEPQIAFHSRGNRRDSLLDERQERETPPYRHLSYILGGGYAFEVMRLFRSCHTRCTQCHSSRCLPKTSLASTIGSSINDHSRPTPCPYVLSLLVELSSDTFRNGREIHRSPRRDEYRADPVKDQVDNRVVDSVLSEDWVDLKE